MAAFIAILISLVLLTILLLCNHRHKNNVYYDYSTDVNKFNLIVAWIFYAVSIIMLIISFVTSFSQNSDDVSTVWILFSFGVFFTLVSLFLLYTLFFENEHILDDEVIIRRFFRKIHIKIKDIKIINRIGKHMNFLDKKQNKIFSIDMRTRGISEFIQILIQKSKELECTFVLEVDGIAQASNTTLDPTNEDHRSEIEKYIKIGVCYKSDYDIRLNEAKITFIGLIVAVITICVGLMIDSFSIMYVIIAVVAIIFFNSHYTKIKLRYAAEMNKPDFELGQNYAHKSDVVYGGSKHKYNLQITGGIVVLVIALINAILSITSLNPYKPDYDNLEKISGTLVYASEYIDTESYIAFGLEDEYPNPDSEFKYTEYRLPEFCLETFNYQLFTLDMYDNYNRPIDYTVTLYVDRSEVYEDISPEDSNKTQYYNVYYVCVDEIEYLNLNMYNSAYNIYNGKNIAELVVYSLLSVASIAWTITFVVKKNQAAKRAYISLYNFE